MNEVPLYVVARADEHVKSATRGLYCFEVEGDQEIPESALKS